MVSRRAVTAFFLVQLIALAVSAQQPAEYLSGTAGEIVLTPKSAAKLSGSLEISTSTGSDVFGGGNAAAYGITAGGTLLQDRLWFFGSASRQSAPSSRWQQLQLPENATSTAVAARVNAQLGRGHDLSAFFNSAQRPELSIAGDTLFAASVPSSFLSLRYTGVVSDNMFFTASVTRSSRTFQSVGSVPVD